MRNSFVLQTYIKFLIFTNLMFYKTFNGLYSKSFKLALILKSEIHPRNLTSRFLKIFGVYNFRIYKCFTQ